MRKIILTTLLLISIVTLSACSGFFVSTGKSEIIDDHTFIDDVGNKYTVNQKYQRIISLYSAHTENIFSLGAEEKLIGVNSTSIYPPAAAFLPIYDYKADPEPIIAANPDVVIARPFINRNYPEYIRAIENAGISVISLYPETSDDFEKYIEILAIITETTDKTEQLFEDYYQKLNGISAKTQAVENRKAIFFESTKTDYRTVTADSNPAKAIEIAGGINIAKDAKAVKRGTTIANFGIENIMINADIIDLYVSQRGAMNSGGSLISIPQREGFMAIKAVREGNILELNEKLISSPTFRYYKGVNEIARALYPEVMDDLTEFENDEYISREDYARMLVKVNHTPMFVPSSSHYYEKEYYNHTYGLFSDVAWNDENFDFIETAVMNSLIKGYEENNIEYFDKTSYVTREDVAFSLYIMGEFELYKPVEIKDIDECTNQDIVKKIVSNELMGLDSNGNFNPKEHMTSQEILSALLKVKNNE